MTMTEMLLMTLMMTGISQTANNFFFEFAPWAFCQTAALCRSCLVMCLWGGPQRETMHHGSEFMCFSVPVFFHVLLGPIRILNDATASLCCLMPAWFHDLYDSFGHPSINFVGTKVRGKREFITFSLRHSHKDSAETAGTSASGGETWL